MAVFLSKKEHHNQKKKGAHRAHQKSTNDLAWNLEPWHSSLQLFFFLPKTPSLRRRVVELTCQSAWQSTKGYLSLFFGLDGRVSSKTIDRRGRPLFVGNAVLFKKICGDGVCAFRRLSETSRKWRSHQSLGSTGTRRVSRAYRDSESPEQRSSGRHVSDFGDGDVRCPSGNT